MMVVAGIVLSHAIVAMALAVPRTYLLLTLMPLIGGNNTTQTVRLGITCVLVLPVALHILDRVSPIPEGMVLLVLLLKEICIGTLLGYLVSVPFWIFESVGFYIDNQRGASIGSTLDPLTGNETAPLGQLTQQVYSVVFFISNGLILIVKLLYDSYSCWDILTWMPHLEGHSLDIMVHSFAHLMNEMALYSAPVIVAMFMVEIGLALASRSAPQLQVFILSMPLKSGVAFFVLVPYIVELVHFMHRHLGEFNTIVPQLQAAWRVP